MAEKSEGTSEEKAVTDERSLAMGGKYLMQQHTTNWLLLAGLC